MMKGYATTVTIMVALALVIAQSHIVSATVYKVGEGNGWRFGTSGWEHGKKFKAGDVLEFVYNKTMHNVVRVDKASYDHCKVPGNAPIFRSGNDKLVLIKGPNYFVCGVPGHCQAGMKIAANAVSVY